MAKKKRIARQRRAAAGVGLTERQLRFAENWIATGNKYQSAVDAGYTEKYAKSRSCELTGHPKIAAYITKRRQENVDDLTRPDRVIGELAALAYADLSDVAYIENGKLKVENTRGLPKEKRVAIAGLKATQFGIDVKPANKQQALRELLRVRERMEDAAGGGPVTVELDEGVARYAR